MSWLGPSAAIADSCLINDLEQTTARRDDARPIINGTSRNSLPFLRYFSPTHSRTADPATPRRSR